MKLKQFQRYSLQINNISFVDLVESGYCDFKQLGMGNELSNYNAMGIIESKLPLDVYSYGMA